MERMLLRDNCVVMQFHCDLTDGKEMVKNLTVRATVLLIAIFLSRQGNSVRAGSHSTRHLICHSYL